MNTCYLKRFAISATAALFLAVAGAAAQPGAAGIEALAKASLAAAPKAKPYDERDWLERFYAPGRYAPVWSERKAKRALALLQDAEAHGLSRDEYDADTLSRQLDSLGAGDPGFDAALTRSMLHYLADLRVGRVTSEYHTILPDPRLNRFDPVSQLRDALGGDSLATAVAAAEPAFPFYARVKDALAHYRGLAATPQQALPFSKTVRPGEPYEAAARLRERLVLLGDLPADAPAGESGSYTPGLADGVRHFQLRHGLAEDGVLGKETMAALNVPLSHRVRQLELTLERLRWLPPLGPGRVIAVNLPAYRLWAINLGAPAQDTAPLEMRVIVGESARTPTPLFIGQMRYLEFNPYWNVPRSIALGEMIPQLMHDRAYLVKHGMELVAAGSKPTSTVSDASLAALRAGTVRIRQRPGPQNALGAVKFAMPNPMNIYLHSTSQRELFARNRRDLSHGCIRVEKPAELAHFVLGDQPGWTIDSVAAAMDPAPMRKVNLSTPIPVVLFYATAMVDREGRVLFSRDIYRRDVALEAALKTHQG